MNKIYIESIESINNALYNLTCRVDSIENLDYKFWIPTVIALISIAYSIYQVWIQNKREILFNIENKIDDAQLQLANKVLELVDNLTTKDIKLKIIDVYIENLINKYDDGCRKYNQYKISRKEFKHKYHQSIIRIFNEYSDKFSNSTSYINIINYYNKEGR